MADPRRPRRRHSTTTILIWSCNRLCTPPLLLPNTKAPIPESGKPQQHSEWNLPPRRKNERGEKRLINDTTIKHPVKYAQPGEKYIINVIARKWASCVVQSTTMKRAKPSEEKLLDNTARKWLCGLHMTTTTMKPAKPGKENTRASAESGKGAPPPHHLLRAMKKKEEEARRRRYL